MSTDTFNTSRMHTYGHGDETPPTLSHRRPGSGEPPGRELTDRVRGLIGCAGDTLDRGLVALRGTWRRLRRRLRETTAGLPVPQASLDTSIVFVWSLAVALVAVEVALTVSAPLGITLALLEGVALGASGRRLYRLVTRT
jgi:hypothetical protein